MAHHWRIRDCAVCTITQTGHVPSDILQRMSAMTRDDLRHEGSASPPDSRPSRTGSHIDVRVAEGATLNRILTSMSAVSGLGLSPRAYATYCRAVGKSAWASAHQERVALIEGTEVLASATRCEFMGILDGATVRIVGIGDLFEDPGHPDAGHVATLTTWLTEGADREGADIVLVHLPNHHSAAAPAGFDRLPVMEVELRVAESKRYGAPMTLVRGGEDRDLAAIVAMGAVRAAPFRFHLNRDADLIKHAVSRRRLRAGLATQGHRQLWFVIAEEGITAAAYMVISVADGVWTIEECGDRDPSGARVGALLQALIAQEPSRERPVIRGWWPVGFLPPQVSVVSSTPATDLVLIRRRRGSATPAGPALTAADVLFWHSDLL